MSAQALVNAEAALAEDDLFAVARILGAMPDHELRALRLAIRLKGSTSSRPSRARQLDLLVRTTSLAEVRTAARILTASGRLEQARPLWSQLGCDLPDCRDWRWPDPTPTPRARRILFLGDAESPHMRRFARYFVTRGSEVHLLSRTRTPLDGVQVHSPETPPKPLDLPGWAEICQATIRDIRPDVVHGHYASIQGLWGALAGFHPYILTLWGSDINVDPFLSAAYRTLVRFCLAQADAITGDCTDLLDNATRLATGISLASGPVVRYIPDPTDFRPGRETASLRQRLQIGPGPVVFSPRQFKPAANIHRIVEAIPRILQDHPDTWFVLATSMTPQDDYSHSLLALADQSGVRDRIRFEADIPGAEMPLWYALADVTLSIRDADAGSVSVMESLLTGTPLVLSDLPSNRELADGVALFVDPHDVQALAGAVCKVLAGGVDVDAMARAGRDRMLAMGSFEEQMQQVAEIYERLCERSVAPYPNPFHASLACARLWAWTTDGTPISRAMLEGLAGLANSARHRAPLRLTAALVGQPWAHANKTGIELALEEIRDGF